MWKIDVNNVELSELANDYENDLYGPDFYSTNREVEHWLASDSFFWAIATQSNIDSGRTEIGGLLSILVTDTAVLNILEDKSARETDIQPWSSSDHGSEMSIYYCSFSAIDGAVGTLLYQKAQRFFKEFYSRNDISPQYAVSVAASRFGEQHLERCGFQKIPMLSYQSKYPVMHARCDSRLRLSWARLLRCNSAGRMI